MDVLITTTMSMKLAEAATLFRIVVRTLETERGEETTHSHYNCSCSRFSFNRHSSDN
jgi:hypothetical protein